MNQKSSFLVCPKGAKAHLIFKKVNNMRLVKVKKKQEEKTFGNMKLVFTMLNVCETTREEGATTLDIYQIYNVTEVWNMEEVQNIVEQQ